MSIKFYLLILINATLLVIGQICWKFAMDKIKVVSLSMLLNPLIVLGLAIYAMSTILWLYILPKVEFSVAYPMNSICYIMAMVAGVFLFGEMLTVGKLMGCILIIGGIFVMFKF